MTRATITFVQYDFDTRILSVELRADTRSQQPLRDAVIQHGHVSDDSTACVRVCVRLTWPESGTDIVFTLLAGSNLFSGSDLVSRFLSNIILDSVYGSRPRVPNSPPQPNIMNSLSLQRILASYSIIVAYNSPGPGPSGTYEHRHIPDFGMQAAYVTGKTVMGALMAARLSVLGELVIATTTRNVAIAQFTETILRLNEFSRLPILLFVADTLLQKGAPRTPADLHTILMGLL
uniref:Proteasome assembly chaperone 3 n=1 Tax=Haemonchus contortus TaxID=6289 RepID=A0A7I4YBK6_HAECO